MTEIFFNVETSKQFNGGGYEVMRNLWDFGSLSSLTKPGYGSGETSNSQSGFHGVAGGFSCRFGPTGCVDLCCGSQTLGSLGP